MSHQRWHLWRNMDETTCPSYGVVRPIVPRYFPPDGQVPGGGLVDRTHAIGFIPGVLQQNYLGTDAEVLGSDLIMHGARPDYQFASDRPDTGYQSSRRGFSNLNAFNGSSPVGPGEIGLLTWDLPTWVAIGGALEFDPNDHITTIFVPDNGTYSFGTIVTGIADWTAATVVNPNVLKDNTGVLYTLAANSLAKLCWVGAGVTFSITHELRQ